MRIKEKFYKETEYLLYNYKMLEISVENMKKEIEYLEKEDEARSISGISYDGFKTGPTFKINSIVEDTLLSISEKISYLEHSIRRMESRMKSINKSMEGLNELEKDILTKKYIEGKQWYVVAYDVKYSERQCRNIRNNAIEKLAIGIFGEIATLLPDDSK
ncbi:hypothetical protein [Wansuia hejianensis]|uniref:Uncharacterized protein n=1 Tax=Wansuia hejianensis TaxID=2763667 RepID=A0A926ILX7_9FIRM|nr:hypothetical protein [Wansuia hejianensis]MBC8590624.1 hypothetical protein [Wansuia hejianensis]